MCLPKHRLIIFYGSSPGSGKSTLSSWLSEQLEGSGFECNWIYEDDVSGLSEFQNFISKVNTNDPTMIDALLEAAKVFVAKRSEDEIIVTDSIFPCYNWLLATGLYDGGLTDFNRKLREILQPLQPQVFFLDISPELALERAAQQRGSAWLEQLIQTVDAYGRNANKPVDNLHDTAAYFGELANESRQLFVGMVYRNTRR